MVVESSSTTSVLFCTQTLGRTSRYMLEPSRKICERKGIKSSLVPSRAHTRRENAKCRPRNPTVPRSPRKMMVEPNRHLFHRTFHRAGACLGAPSREPGAMYDHKVLPDMTGVRPDSAISLIRFDPAKEMDILRVRVIQSPRPRLQYACCAHRHMLPTFRPAGATPRYDTKSESPLEPQGRSSQTTTLILSFKKSPMFRVSCPASWCLRSKIVLVP